MSTERDTRYENVKLRIEAGRINQFKEMFDHNNIPKSIVYKDLGTSFNRFKKMLAKPTLFSLDELILLAKFIDVDVQIIIDLALQKHRAGKKGSKK